MGQKLLPVTGVVTGFLGSVWNGIRTIISTVLNGIRGTVNSVWNGIRNTISSVVNGIKNTVSSAFNTMWSGIRSTISGIYNTIRSHLHFSVPDEGPLTDFESWMPDFMNGLVEGIEKSRGMVKAAVNSVAADMVVSPQMAVADGGMMTGTGSSGSADLTAGIVAALKDVLGDQKEQQGDLVIPVYLGNQLLDEVIVTAQQRMSLRSGGR